MPTSPICCVKSSAHWNFPKMSAPTLNRATTSLAAAPDDPEALSAVSQNTPGFGTLYQLPLDALKKLKIPVSMIGTYGYDAHKYTERLEKAYSFETMPDILRSVIRDLLA